MGKSAGITIFHNPRCSKSREALNLLKEQGAVIEIKEYLKIPPTHDELKTLLAKLNCKATEIIRTKEDLFIAKYKNKNFSEEEWIQILSENPILIERPIIIKGNRAIIGRPPELVKQLF